MLQTLKFALVVFFLVAFFHKSVFAEEEVISSDDFAFIGQYKGEEIIETRLGVLSKTIGLYLSEAANAGMIYYGCIAFNNIFANSPSGPAASKIDGNDQSKLGKNDLCLILVSVIAPNEAAMVSRTSPWPNVYPWLETVQVLGAAASGYYMYRLKDIKDREVTVISPDSLQNESLAVLTGVLGFLAMSSLSSTFAALGAAVTGVKKSNFDSDDARRVYVYAYKAIDLALACAATATVARFALVYSGHSEKKAAVLSSLLGGLAGMLASFPVTDVPGQLKWAEPIKIPSFENFRSNTSGAIDDMIDSFQLPLSYETKSRYSLGAGKGAVIGVLSGAVAAAIYPVAGLGSAAVYAAMASASGAMAGTYTSGAAPVLPFLGGLLGVLAVPLIQKHTSLKEAGAKGLIAQTAVSFGVVVFINSLVNYFTESQSIENTLTETNKWLWRKIYLPAEYLKHILSLN